MNFLKKFIMFNRPGKDRTAFSQGSSETGSESMSTPPPVDNLQEIKNGPHMRGKRIKIDFLVHDLKVPLAVIEAGVVSLLNKQKKYGPLTEKQEKVLERTLRNTKTSQTLVNDILELGRARHGILNLKNLSVSSLIEQAFVEIFDLVDHRTSEKIKSCTALLPLRKVLEEKGLILIVNEDIWCEEICLDVAKVRQIFRNLLNNALKYRKSRVELEVDREDGFLVFSVKDDGEGIPSAYHEKIFESYFQMDPSDMFTVRGHGLGLAGVMALIEDLGGMLFLESSEGKGAKFSVKLPLTVNK